MQNKPQTFVVVSKNFCGSFPPVALSLSLLPAPVKATLACHCSLQLACALRTFALALLSARMLFLCTYVATLPSFFRSPYCSLLQSIFFCLKCLPFLVSVANPELAFPELAFAFLVSVVSSHVFGFLVALSHPSENGLPEVRSEALSPPAPKRCSLRNE